MLWVIVFVKIFEHWFISICLMIHCIPGFMKFVVHVHVHVCHFIFLALNWPIRKSCLVDMFRGISYLHAGHLIHQDIKRLLTVSFSMFL